MTNPVEPVRDAIWRVVAENGAELVKDYYSETGPFAGRLFDELPNNIPNEFTPEDLVAASMLDVRFNPKAVRALLVAPDEVNELLGRPGTGPATVGDARPLGR